MKKYLVTMEFRYSDVSKDNCDIDCKIKNITTGVYDTQHEAIEKGNNELEKLEKYFPLNPHCKERRRFSKNGGCLGGFDNLVTNLGWIVTPFDVYAKITTLDYQDVEETINKVLDAQKRYKEYKDNLK